MTLESALTDLADWVGRSGRVSSALLRAEWAGILLPHDDRTWAMAYLESKGASNPTSTCALVALRFLAHAGCTCYEHSVRYVSRIGNAIPDVERIARRHGAWRTGADLGVYPEPGDIVGVDLGQPHVLVVVGSDAATGNVLSIDGGQSDSTYTLARARRMVADPYPTLVDVDDGVSSRVGRRRALYGRVDTAQILASLEKCS